MQVLFPKHVWLHTEYMPTLDWRTGASYISLRVIGVTWWITSVTLIHHRSTAYESFTTGPRYVTLSRLVPCYKRDWATLLPLLLLLLLFCCCYCCSLLLRCYLLQDSFPTPLPGKNSYSPTCNLLTPLIQQFGIVCRQQIVSGTVAIILLWYWYFSCRY